MLGDNMKILEVHKIERWNCDGLCMEESCDEEPVYVAKVEHNEHRFFIPLCKKHSGKVRE